MSLLLAVQHMADPFVHPLFLEVGLAALGAVVGGLLLTSIMRITRSFASAMSPPEWGREQMSFPAWLIVSLNLNLILPAVGAVIWVRNFWHLTCLLLLGASVSCQTDVESKSCSTAAC